MTVRAHKYTHTHSSTRTLRIIYTCIGRRARAVRGAHQEAVHSSQRERAAARVRAWCAVRADPCATYIYINCAIAGELHKIATKCVQREKHSWSHSPAASGTPVAFIYKRICSVGNACARTEVRCSATAPVASERAATRARTGHDLHRRVWAPCAHVHNNLSPLLLPRPLLPLRLL